jgi:hypothetical protein
MQYPTIEDIAALIGILATLCGAVVWLFKKTAIDPLRASIDALNETIRGIREDTDKRLGKLEGRVDKIEDHDARHEERIKTLFERLPR